MHQPSKAYRRLRWLLGSTCLFGQPLLLLLLVSSTSIVRSLGHGVVLGGVFTVIAAISAIWFVDATTVGGRVFPVGVGEMHFWWLVAPCSLFIVLAFTVYRRVVTVFQYDLDSLVVFTYTGNFLFIWGIALLWSAWKATKVNPEH